MIEIQKSSQRPRVSWCQAGKPAPRPWRRDTRRKADESALGCGHAPCHCLGATRPRHRWPAVPRRALTQTRSRALGGRSACTWARASSGAWVGCAGRADRGARSPRAGRTPRRRAGSASGAAGRDAPEPAHSGLVVHQSSIDGSNFRQTSV